MNDYKNIINVTIASGTALSSAVSVDGYTIVGIQMPSAWTTAGITFKGATDQSANVANIYDDLGTEYTVSASSSRYITINPSKLSGIKWISLRSGTSGTPVNQASARTIGLVVREV